MTDQRRRRFNQSERNEIYRRANGLCETCGNPLGDDWEADHDVPFGRGGETTVENGRATCAHCNAKKGARMPDGIVMRRFQRELVQIAMARIAAGDKTTVALVGAGSGKTLAYLAFLNAAFREGLITAAAIYTPRRSLRGQGEEDCVDYLAKCSPPRMGEIIARENIAPLLPRDKFGFVACYQSLVSDGNNKDDQQLHVNWAKENAGRFILILDEAQFVGLEEEDGGTRASRMVLEMAEHALHVLILTATPTRSDGRPLALCEYGDPDEKGFRALKWHVRATYLEGVALGYLRPCEFHLSNGDGHFTDGEAFTIEELEKRLTKVLRVESIWQSIVDDAIKQFRVRRLLHNGYRLLVACVDQDHARKVHAYVHRRYPEFSTVMASSDDNDHANSVLKAFKPADKGGSNSGDILISVAMAYIGFDCPPISVVCNLSSKRWPGWLEQLIMRGGRMWKARPVEEQMLIVVGPNDPLMAKFAERFRADSIAGLRERNNPPPPPPLSPSDDVGVEDAQITDQICLGLSVDQDLTAEEVEGLKGLQAQLSRPIDLTLLGEAFRKAGRDIPQAEAPSRTRQQTWTERRRDYGRQQQNRLKAILAKRGIKSWERPADFQAGIRRLQVELNTLQGVKTAEYLTEAQWQERMRILDRWGGNGDE